jgi:hypothetical protein
MARALLIVLTFVTLTTACTQRMVCPAYQSAFVHDKDALRKKFSYFVGDSTPKLYASARKNKFLVGEAVPYKKKVRSIQTVAMRPINPVVPDSLQEGYKKELDVSDVERNVFDSTAVLRIDTLDMPTQDSIYMISKDREVRVLKYNNMKRQYYVDTIGFNTQQDSYMWYLRDWLVLPDARIAKQKPEEEEKKEKKGGFFKNLFKKKDKKRTTSDDLSQELASDEAEDYGYDDFEDKVKDTTAVAPESSQPQTKTKAKKKKKATEPKAKPSKKKAEPEPAKKEEEEDDGF